ncbi:hypothetical protein AVEN_24788-1 [Araneus ventricosus]|uniref:Uncharacterized protein n=1 Tax=Araneus ventricosus TaxID=182803 RepID=A0A4Y2VLZ4_ARAVE|nr:hypothetical protein AVEN_240554-1 [Araneus ventricosus]GBO25632.1 hypothetical protein AVEN_255054-1 [Araneus ventricosus]GBO25635.1 hypothetical protein AVEN_20523-1 [Araneus ventricosus]GBO25636.1 hypothetical protein AVEN_24788-1 [Araneus ventricosus]
MNPLSPNPRPATAAHIRAVYKRPLRENRYSRIQRDRSKALAQNTSSHKHMVVEAFVVSVHQRNETNIEEIGIKVVQQRQDCLLNFCIGSEISTSQVLLQRSREIKITCSEVWGVGRALQ